MENLETIYKENYEIVYKYLLSLTGNVDISEELTQETFYKATININKFKKESKLSTWLCKIARNLWIDELKRKNRIRKLEENDIIVTEEVFLEKAEIMNTTENWVRVTFYRGKEKLKEVNSNEKKSRV